MGSILARHRIVTALIALFVAVLVLVPSIDAVACSTELEPTHAAQVMEGDTGEGEDIGSAHGVCSHGHCHHVSTPLGGTQELDTSAWLEGRSRAIIGDDLLSSRVPAGPERPPRV
ncbi:hypothetical protein [Brevundimonas aurifodinae]|uniref:Secreted protein n=1 Tax=Brevundimonas aurifodinae TaxID=1508312 RepID=A0ABV1NMC7_9CAUL